jgi:hypothetical protein
MKGIDSNSANLKIRQNASAFASGIKLVAPLEAKKLWDYLKCTKKNL